MVKEHKNNDQDQEGREGSSEEMIENDLDQVFGGVQSIASNNGDNQGQGITNTTFDTGYVYHPIKSSETKI